jgi:serine/threonine protein phosphatase PrpC
MLEISFDAFPRRLASPESFKRKFWNGTKFLALANGIWKICKLPQSEIVNVIASSSNPMITDELILFDFSVVPKTPLVFGPQSLPLVGRISYYFLRIKA